MIYAPSFAFTMLDPHLTFSLNIQNDPRMTFWHCRAWRLKNFVWQAKDFYAKTNHNPIFPIQKYVSPAYLKQDYLTDCLGFAQTCSYSLSRKFFTNLKGDEWGRWETEPKQTICPNLSLTRYDWHENKTPAFYKMGMKHSHSLPPTSHYQFGWKIPEWRRIPLLFGISEIDFVAGITEPSYLTRRHCGKLIHGPSWEIKNGR